MKSDFSKKTVLIALRMSGIAGRDKLAGIFRYLSPLADSTSADPATGRPASSDHPPALQSEICNLRSPAPTHSSIALQSEICNLRSIPPTRPPALQSEICDLKSPPSDNGWDLTLIRSASELTPARLRTALASGIDGLIVSIPEATRANALLATITTPTVVLDTHDATLAARTDNIVFIHNSAEEIGHAAADFLISTGRCRSYAFVENPAVAEWSAARFRAYRDALRDRGFWCHDLAAPKDLAALERPIGVFAANDDTGYETLEWCRAHRIRVPEDALVLGLNNDTLICENCRPRLTSIQPDFEAEGYLAAQALSQMMSHGIPHDQDTKRATRSVKPKGGHCRPSTFNHQPSTLSVGVKTIVRRDSTAEVSPAGKLVQKAVAYIRAHALEGISARDVVRHLGCSRRLADLRFRELQQTSIGEMIISLRLDEVRLRLATTREPIDSIAHSCGYENTNYLKNLFRKRFGMPMRDYRARHRINGPGRG